MSTFPELLGIHTQDNTMKSNSNQSSQFSLANSTIQQLEKQQTTTDFMAFKVFFYFGILACSTIGNALVASIIASTKRMRTPSNILILNLSICDLITPLISIPFDFILEENNYEWYYGTFMCKFLWPFATLTATSSSLTLAVISLDRYRIIMHPFKCKLTSKHVKIFIAVIHFTSLVMVSPYMNALKLRDASCDEHWPEFSHRQFYTFSLFLVQYAVPLMYMIVMYTLAVRNLNVSSGKMRKCSIKGRHALLSKKKSNHLNNPNALATKMFILVVLVFAIFMFPNQVIWLWADFGNGLEHPNFRMIANICWLFTYTNSVCNPVIYFMFSKDFRTGLKKVLVIFRIWKLKCQWKRSRANSKQSHSNSFRTGTETLTPSVTDTVNVHQIQHIAVYASTNELDQTFDVCSFSRDKRNFEAQEILAGDCQITLVGKHQEPLTGIKDAARKTYDLDDVDVMARCNFNIIHRNSLEINANDLDNLKALPETDC